MATLEKIRTKAGLLVAIVIGLSLAAFILGDMLQSGSSILQKNRLQIGEINGEAIQYPEFQSMSEELANIYKMNSNQSSLDDNAWTQIREQTWQTMVLENVMGDVYKDLGLDVSSDELFDMIQGTHLHPIIQQMFTNPNTGQVDRASIISFLKNLDTGAVSPENRQYWLYLENQIQEDRLQTKYTNLVGKGLYVTSEVAEESLAEKDKQVNFDYIMISQSSVADSLVSATDRDLRDYYSAHQNDYKQEKLREIEYIVFPVTPSASDFQAAEKWINDIKPDFEETNENEQFVNSNSDVSFDNTWYKEEDLPENLAQWVFEEGADTNQVLGPYFQDNSYILSKVNAIKMLPDSVRARHILLQVNTQAELPVKEALADSLKTLIENGGDFATLARQYSVDGSAAIGGDLGWFTRGQMVPSFEESAFNNAKNEVSITTSQYGIHIIQTTELGKLSKHVQIASLVRKVSPSTKTYQDVYSEASKFAADNKTKTEFDAAIAEQNLTKKVASVGENDQAIAELDNSRSLIRAAYETDEGKIIVSDQQSPIFELGDNYVIAALTKITEEGIAAFDDVKARVELNVLREKKADYLVDKINAEMEDNANLEDLATNLGTTVQNAQNVTFNSFQLPGVGLEPAVIGTATNLEVDKISKPIAGNNGVFVVQVTSSNELDNQDVANEKTTLAQSNYIRASSQAFETHRNSADIVDERSKFF